MKISSSTGSFELRIQGYGPKEIHGRERHSLLCELSTQREERTFIQQTPLKTWEINRLLNGLRLLSKRVVTHQTLTLAQPGVSVNARALPDQQYQVLILLTNPQTPSWYPYPESGCLMDATLSRQQLKEAIKDLSRQLASLATPLPASTK